MLFLALHKYWTFIWRKHINYKTLNIVYNGAKVLYKTYILKNNDSLRYKRFIILKYSRPYFFLGSHSNKNLELEMAQSWKAYQYLTISWQVP